mgnify:CR=1 FL=1|tara:strand:+ start:53 stop:502 length:450 start_codon:yes stop_codon:yes gene_type:complete
MKAVFPAAGSKMMNLSLTAAVRYFDLENTTSSNVQETAQMIGPGLGIDIQMYILNFGYSVYMMRARHQSVGLVSNNLEYTFMHTGYHAGLIKTFRALSLGLIYTSSTGSIEKSETNLSKDVDFKEETIWFLLKYDFGTSTKKFLNSLVK